MPELATALPKLLHLVPLLVAIAALGGLCWGPSRGLAATLAPWLPGLALLLPFYRIAYLDLPSVLLGSRLLFDGFAIATAIASGLLFLLMGTLNARQFRRAPGEAACFLLAWSGVLTLCLAGDLLLFLAGTAVAGYAMLSLSALARRAVTPLSAAAIAAMLLASGLAMLELATLLVEAGASSFFEAVRVNLATMRGKFLVEFCLVLGYAAPLALAINVPIWLAGSSAPLADKVGLIPGWLAIGIGAVLGRSRIENGAAFADGNLAWGMELAWAPPLVVLVFFLPAILGISLRGLLLVGQRVERLRIQVVAKLPGPETLDRIHGGWARSVEKRLTDWTTATSLLVLTAVVLLIAGWRLAPG